MSFEEIDLLEDSLHYLSKEYLRDIIKALTVEIDRLTSVIYDQKEKLEEVSN